MKRHGEKFSARLSKQVYLEGKVTQNHNEVKWDTVNTILKNKYALQIYQFFCFGDAQSKGKAWLSLFWLTLFYFPLRTKVQRHCSEFGHLFKVSQDAIKNVFLQLVCQQGAISSQYPLRTTDILKINASNYMLPTLSQIFSLNSYLQAVSALQTFARTVLEHCTLDF